MTTETDVKQRLAALRATLAGATMACPDCEGDGILLGAVCFVCHGEKRVPRFPDFRQDCDCPGTLQEWREDIHEYIEVQTVCSPHCDGKHGAGCLCGGRRWQVRAGGMEDALAGLTNEQGAEVYTGLRDGVTGTWKSNVRQWISRKHDPMPDRDTILVKTLELVIEATGLEVPPACAS